MPTCGSAWLDDVAGRFIYCHHLVPAEPARNERVDTIMINDPQSSRARHNRSPPAARQSSARLDTHADDEETHRPEPRLSRSDCVEAVGDSSAADAVRIVADKARAAGRPTT